MRKRSIISIAVAIAGFALAYRREGQAQRRTIETLRPQGAKASRSPSPEQRGTHAESPREIAPVGWWQVAKRTAAKFSENELMSEAAAVTFYALLSLFPAITAIVSIYGLFADRATIASQLDSLSSFMPSGGVEIIRDQIHRLLESPASGLSVGAAVGLLTALWSANAGTKAMFSALNDVYGEREERGFVTLAIVSLAFTLGGIAFLLTAVFLTVLLPKLFVLFGLGAAYAFVTRIVAFPLAALALITALAVLYRYGPSRAPARWQWVSWGGAIGALAWVGLSLGFSWYVAHFGNYNKTYGSLGAVIGFMTWIWLSTTVILLGAQLNAELEVQTMRDTTTGPSKALGSRGASAADTVA